ncbi:MAG: hypothetical protein WC511_04790 [Candidatus Pacearchaeota archaeon]|jgi:hypothetical protein
METHWKFPYYSISSEEMKIIFRDRKRQKKLENMLPLEDGLTMRYIEIYLDKGEITYIVHDWEKEKSGRVKTESFFSKDL